MFRFFINLGSVFKTGLFLNLKIGYNKEYGVFERH